MDKDRERKRDREKEREREREKVINKKEVTGHHVFLEHG